MSINQQTDLVLMIRAGRGNTGGTTALDASIQLAASSGRQPIILDAARNPTLSALYSTIAARPASHAVGDVKIAMTKVLDQMLDDNENGVIDLGGGQDDTLAEYGLDLNISEYCKDNGIKPVFLATYGPQYDDFEHIMQIKRRGIFDDSHVLLVQNEGMLKRDQDPSIVFGEIEHRHDYRAWVEKEGARPLYLESLSCLPEIRKLGLSIVDAAENKPGKDGERLGRTKAWIAKKWLKKWQEQFKQFDCEDWTV